MEYSYNVMFSFKEIGDDTLKYGQTTISTDEPIDATNEDQLREVGRAIGTSNNYSHVAINTTIPPMENLDKAIALQKDAFGLPVKRGEIEKG